MNSLLSPGTVKAGGVRFSEESSVAGATAGAAAATPSHVHFEEKLHDSVVMVTPEADGNFLVKVHIMTLLSSCPFHICVLLHLCIYILYK